MKSFLDVRSQSQTSIKSRLSLSSGFKSLENDKFFFSSNFIYMYIYMYNQRVHSQNDSLVPFGIQRGLDRLRFLLHGVRIWNQLQLDVWIRQSVWIHRNQISPLFHWKFDTRIHRKHVTHFFPCYRFKPFNLPLAWIISTYIRRRDMMGKKDLIRDN